MDTRLVKATTRRSGDEVDRKRERVRASRGAAASRCRARRSAARARHRTPRSPPTRSAAGGRRAPARRRARAVWRSRRGALPIARAAARRRSGSRAPGHRRGGTAAARGRARSASRRPLTPPVAPGRRTHVRLAGESRIVGVGSCARRRVEADLPEDGIELRRGPLDRHAGRRRPITSIHVPNASFHGGSLSLSLARRPASEW